MPGRAGPAAMRAARTVLAFTTGSASSPVAARTTAPTRNGARTPNICPTTPPRTAPRGTAPYPRADQMLPDGPGAVQLAVGALQSVGVAGDQRRDERLGGVVEQCLDAPQQEPDGGQQRDGRPARQHRHTQDRDQGEAAPVDAPHHPAPIPAVDQRTADQPEQQPGQPAGKGDQRDRQRVATERGRQQRQGGQNHPITGRGDSHGGPQPVVAGPEIASGLGGSSTKAGHRSSSWSPRSAAGRMTSRIRH